jgi:beta-N-acetylhexosaminidase
VSQPLASAAASLFLVGFEGTLLSDPIRARLDEGVGGVVLFRRNIENRDQVGELVARIREFAARPLLVAVDQEGGKVQRLREGFPSFHPRAPWLTNSRLPR